MKRVIILLLAFVGQPLVTQEVIPLWTGSPPHSKPNTLKETVIESWGVRCLKNVTTPTLTVHRAQGDHSRHAMIILPGGGYAVESFVAEGQRIAEYLSSKGIVAAVLKYRLPLTEASDQPHLLPVTDARRAIALMKSRADDYGFDVSHVGIMGFSASGHLAATVSVWKADEPNENTDFSALIYPVTTLSAENRKWLEQSLFHRQMTDEEKQRYDLVCNVTESTPPAFLLHACDDVVPVNESLLYARVLTDAGRHVEMHLFARGGHGFGPGRAEDGTAQWLGLLANWIKRRWALRIQRSVSFVWSSSSRGIRPASQGKPPHRLRWPTTGQVRGKKTLRYPFSQLS